MHDAALSSAQRWYARLFTSRLRAHAVMSFMVELPQAVSDLELTSAILELLVRHDSLRCRFEDSCGALLQYVMQPDELPGGGRDAQALSAEILRHASVAGNMVQALDTARDLTMEQSAAGIPLSAAPLLRGSVVRAASGRAILSVVAHHLVFDRMSATLFRADLMGLLGLAAERSPKAGSYGAFSRWSLDHERTRAAADDRSYWERNLEGFWRPCRLPRPPDKEAEVGGQARITLPATTRAAARATARSMRVSDFAFLATAFTAMCHEIYAMNDIIIMMPVDMRYHYRREPGIGMHMNFVPVRHRLKQGESIEEGVRSIARGIVKGLRHGGYALDRIAVGKVDVNYSGHFPLSGALINSEQIEMDDSPVAPTPLIDPMGRIPAFDVQLYLTESRERTDAVWQYNPLAMSKEVWPTLPLTYIKVISLMCERPQGSFDLLLREITRNATR